MDKSQTFNTLEVNSIKTNKLDYSYSNNVLYINNLNAKHIKLDSSFSNYYLVTQDNNMDIIINLSSQTIGTRFRVLITNIQKSLKISCVNSNDKFKGVIKINNNSGNINQESLTNNLRKKITLSSDNSEVLYIPSYKLGLYNGGYIDLIYTGNKYCNKPEDIQIGYWLVNSELIGLINLPKTIQPLVNNSYILTLYILPDKNKIICATTKNPIDNTVYFNNVTNNITNNVTNNNNINIFLDLTYTIHIITVDNNNLVYNSETYNSSIDTNIYNIEICNNFLSTDANTYISLNDIVDNNSNTLKFISDYSNEIEKYNIQETYNTNISDYNKLNIINYNIKKGSNTIISGNFNIISMRSYNNSDVNNNILPSLLFGNYNIFTHNNNNIILDESKY